MAERNFPIQVVGVEYICDKCGIGTMKSHGKVACPADPVEYPHSCTHCGATAELTERYPTVRHLRVETGESND
jgi:DNA-directed RNA polymerase subunit RPC12/RpoP